MDIKNKFLKHRITRSAFALGILQLSNYAIPLIILPLLTRKLGVDEFGTVAIVFAVAQLIYVLTDYGFSLSATYAISVRRDSQGYINNKIGSIFGVKIIIIAIAAVVTLPLSMYMQHDNAVLYSIFALIAGAAQSLQPIWLFQGTERMKLIALYSIVTKVIYAALVLALIHGPEDAIFVIGSWAMAQVIGLVVSIYLLYKDGHSIFLPSASDIRREFEEGAEYFWSRIAVSIYTSASTIVVGTTSAYQAAHFSVCNQIYKAGQSLTSPINTAMFPYMAKEKDWKIFYRIFVYSITILSLGCLGVGIISENLLGIIFGEEYRAAAPTLIIFLTISIVNYVAVTFGYSAFAALGRTDVANKSVLAGAALHIIILAYLFVTGGVSAVSVAVAILITEVVVMATRVYFFLRISAHQNRDGSNE